MQTVKKILGAATAALLRAPAGVGQARVSVLAPDPIGVPVEPRGAPQPASWALMRPGGGGPLGALLRRRRDQISPAFA
jgi:hypothetical protein